MLLILLTLISFTGFSSVLAFELGPENTLERCMDGEDNDGDEDVDLGDSDCASHAVIILPPETPATTTAPTPSISGGDWVGASFGSSGPSSSGFSSGLSAGTPVSSIVSTTTSTTTAVTTTTRPVCVDSFTKYMKRGSSANDVNEVKKLQDFLNQNLNINIPVTGFFGSLTQAGVIKFQLKYSNEILTPWGLTNATGYFYRTSMTKANSLMCQSI